jgi:hypothetical protein
MERGHTAMPEQKKLVENSGLFRITESRGLTILAALQL